MQSERNYGIDLLRIVSMFLICIAHVLGAGGMINASVGNTNKVLWLFESIAYCSIEMYGMISGYVSNTKKVKLSRIIGMWFQVIFYTLVITCLLRLLKIGNVNERLLLFDVCMPIINNKYWYFTAYFALFFFMPLINNALDKFEENDLKKLFVILIVVFSILTIINDNYAADGYSFVWLLVLFVEGGIIKRVNLLDNVSNKVLIFLFCLFIVITWLPYYFFESRIFIEHTSPTILCASISLLIIFSRLNIKSKAIELLTPLVFGVYLFQCNEIIWNSIISGAFDFVKNCNMIFTICYMFIFAFIIFIIGVVVEWIRVKLFKLLKIDYVIIKISNVFDHVLIKLASIL